MSSTENNDLYIFGIRHHGPGSARGLVQALTVLQPDIVLVEGPPDADEIIPLLAEEEMEPPVALLVYRPDRPRRASYIPLALFSPEWQALRYAVRQGIPARFMDLPHARRFAELDELAEQQGGETGEEGEQTAVSRSQQALQTLAQASGYSDYESWWNQVIEQRQAHDEDVFAAIFRVMSVLRNEADMLAMGTTPTKSDLFEARREAYMRRTIRQARKEGFQRIAVVCGAWHAPALAEEVSAKADKALLKGMKRVKVAATWVPWTYGRLATRSGYGAGIQAPGWYHHLWEMGENGRSATDIGIYWLTLVAELLREQDLDASAAHVIEAVRLAEALAAIRQHPIPGLQEFNEATQTIMCFGDTEPMALIRDKLIVGERMGSVPPSTPMVPLQRDLYRLQKRLRLYPDPDISTLSLDLRKPVHLERSQLLHRLQLLGIPWGQSEPIKDSQGTYLELWRMQWKPEFAVLLIEASMWGTTVLEAASQLASERATKATKLSELTELLNLVLLADLPEVIVPLMARLGQVSAMSSDVAHMMEALPPLVRVLRYGNVRQINREVVQQVVDGLVTRICIGLPSSCASLNDEAAAEMYTHLVRTHGLLKTMQQEHHLTAWYGVLAQLADNLAMHGLLTGRACRLLLDDRQWSREEVMQRLRLMLSVTQTAVVAHPQQGATGSPPALLQAAMWIEGFLKDSGLILIHDDELWHILDGWVLLLQEENFMAQLPLLRRTFATFTEAERQQLTQRAKQGDRRDAVAATQSHFDQQRADTILPLMAQLLGVESGA